jgi:hypothetical protein
LVYLLTCKNCGIQYVGETRQRLSFRLNGHRAGTFDPAKSTGCVHITEHFSEGSCKDAGFFVQIIEKMDDSLPEKVRKDREKLWIKRLWTLYPYGLNDRLDYREQEHVADNFLPRRHRPKRKRGRKVSRSHNNADPCALFSHLTEASHSSSDFASAIRSQLSNLPHRKLRTVLDLLYADGDKSFSARNSLLLSDFICSRLSPAGKTNDFNQDSRPSKSLCVFFHNKAVDFINLPKIVNSAETSGLLPTTDKNNVSLFFKLRPPIRSKIFNYRQFVTSEEFSSAQECMCHISPFKDDTHGHVCSGDLRLVQNPKLRRLFSKGPNYREPVPLNWTKARECIADGLRSSVSNWSRLDGYPESEYISFVSFVLKCVDEKIAKCKQSLRFRRTKPILQDPDAITELKRLHKLYVIVPVDKASKNIAFVCKKFYKFVLDNEVGADSPATSGSYEPVTLPKSQVIAQQTAFVDSNGFTRNYDELPFMYWLPKFHKKPTKFRFIVASSRCVTKDVSKPLSKALRLCLKMQRAYCRAILAARGHNRMFVIDNSAPLLKELDCASRRNAAKSVATFDFSTLYTSIPLEKLRMAISWVISKSFKGTSKRFLTVTDYDAYFSSAKSKTYLSGSQNELVKWMDFLINNTYFTIGDRIYRQRIGIPMGTDAAPYLANLFLYYYEFQYLERHNKNPLVCARLSRCFRYIDDLIYLGIPDFFAKTALDIYPPELTLNRENTDASTATFLDLEITVSNGKYVTRLYDKRNDFPFSVVNYPHSDCNIPRNVVHGVIVSQVLRICRASTNIDSFIQSSRHFIGKLMRNGYDYDAVLRSISLMQCIRRQEITHKYGLPMKRLLMMLRIR